MAQVKCQICEQRDCKTKMLQETNKKYYHIAICHQKYIEQQEIKKSENMKWSLLFEYIKELHGLIDVPTRNIKRLHELRNGFDIKDGQRVQRYKQGVEYDLMLDSYKLQEDKIRWFIKSVLNDGKDASDINKCISMMLNSLNTAWQNRQAKIKQDQQLQKDLSTLITNDMSIDEPVIKRKKRDDGDISDLL